jgi:type III restriction enzyme
VVGFPFAVVITIKDAEQARDMLEKDFNVRTLLVTKESDKEEYEAARRLGKPGSPYEAVVSVLMLREGWDVPTVSVILLLRKFSSQVYGQQVVGRGLGRPDGAPPGAGETRPEERLHHAGAGKPVLWAG